MINKQFFEIRKKNPKTLYTIKKYIVLYYILLVVEPENAHYD